MSHPIPFHSAPIVSLTTTMKPRTGTAPPINNNPPLPPLPPTPPLKTFFYILTPEKVRKITVSRDRRQATHTAGNNVSAQGSLSALACRVHKKKIKKTVAHDFSRYSCGFPVLAGLGDLRGQSQCAIPPLGLGSKGGMQWLVVHRLGAVGSAGCFGLRLSCAFPCDAILP